MMLVIRTQFMENYGAHDWDGKGECPQYWKFKGGSEYKLTGVDSTSDIQDYINLADVEYSNEYAREYILSATFEADNYLSDYEKSQLEYEGRIIYAEPTLTWEEMEAQVMSTSTEMVWNRKVNVEEVA